VRSSATVLLLGIGADEQMGGYGRHRSAFRAGGWAALQRELILDVARLWRRNLGRDDRVCSDHGREVRLPFLDEDVMALVASLPLPLLADLRLGHGIGDKRVLRAAARIAGLGPSTCLVKRAIQFGSRIAKHSNVHAFGSNRAAAGDAAISPVALALGLAPAGACGGGRGLGVDDEGED
jgi:asparagine synthetase B (glutamine-hydrolysing)